MTGVHAGAGAGSQEPFVVPAPGEDSRDGEDGSSGDGNGNGDDSTSDDSLFG